VTKPTPIETRMAAHPGQAQRPQVIGGRSDTVPTAPRSLSPEARREWRRLATMLIEAGIWDQSDSLLLETVCSMVARLREVRSVLNDLAAGKMQVAQGRDMRASTVLDVFVAPSVRGTVRNPLVATEVELSNAVRLGLLDLGLSPVGRTRTARAKGTGSNLQGLRSGLRPKTG
jgi:P27 family predicted phage terminase small subunit